MSNGQSVTPSKQPSRLRQTVFAGIMVALMLILIEGLSAIGVYYFHVVDKRPFTASNSAALYALNLALGGGSPEEDAIVIDIQPRPYNQASQTLGYEAAPGTYRIETSRGDKTLLFEVTIEADGGRRTAYRSVAADRQILVFGDSYVWGYGNYDQETFPWLLQDRYRDRARVHNFAFPGYGTVQEMLSIEERLDGIRSDDIVVVTYAAFYGIRDVASPKWIRSADEWRRRNPTSPEARSIPYGVVSDGTLSIEYRPASCAAIGDWCDRPEPSQETMEEVAIAAFERIQASLQSKGAYLVVAFTDGGENEVIKHLRQAGVAVADLRPDPLRFEYDNYRPVDWHPGPLGHFHYFRKLSAFLEANDLIDPPSPLASQSGDE